MTTSIDDQLEQKALAWLRSEGLDQTGRPIERAIALVGLLTQVRELADRAADDRWCAAMETADWDGGVFHYDGRIYPWPKGFVPDCPATWDPHIRAEREACAAIAEVYHAPEERLQINESIASNMAATIAQAIRARGTP